MNFYIKKYLNSHKKNFFILHLILEEHLVLIFGEVLIMILN